MASLEDFKDVLVAFCKTNATLTYTAGDLENAVVQERVDLLYLLKKLNTQKEALLSIKEELSLKGGVSFLEDFKFGTNLLSKEGDIPDFEIKDGVFVGDKEKAYEVASKWLDEDFEDNPYKFEKANFLLSLIFWSETEET